MRGRRAWESRVPRRGWDRARPSRSLAASRAGGNWGSNAIGYSPASSHHVSPWVIDDTLGAMRLQVAPKADSGFVFPVKAEADPGNVDEIAVVQRRGANQRDVIAENLFCVWPRIERVPSTVATEERGAFRGEPAG